MVYNYVQNKKDKLKAAVRFSYASFVQGIDLCMSFLQADLVQNARRLLVVTRPVSIF
jgi:hypothetical protein